jgi:SLT domain-containing protein
VTTLRALLMQAGFHGHGLETAMAIALAESGGHPRSHNTNAGTGDNSYGLFQINMINQLGPARRAQFGLSSNDELFDPLTNAVSTIRGQSQSLSTLTDLGQAHLLFRILDRSPAA